MCYLCLNVSLLHFSHSNVLQNVRMRTTLTLRAEELVMRAYCDESHRAYTFVVKDCAVVASDVNASAARIFTVEEMIIKKRMELIGLEKINPLLAFDANALRQFLEAFPEFLG